MHPPSFIDKGMRTREVVSCPRLYSKDVSKGNIDSSLKCLSFYAVASLSWTGCRGFLWSLPHETSVSHWLSALCRLSGS